MKRRMRIISFLVLNIMFSSHIFAQGINLDIHLNVKHKVGDITEFSRKKFINLHASLTENDWTGEMDKMDYIISDLDVYLGRDNGNMGWYMNQATEDPGRSGFVDPSYMTSKGTYARETVYGINKADRHKYEDNADMIFGGQESPFWPGHSTKPSNGDPGWLIGGAAASGDYMGRYFNEFFRNEGEGPTKGHPRPKYMEIINEPLYGLVDEGDHTPTEVFQYHNDMADAIREHNTDVQIGGYTTAFPIFEENNFQRWEERMKLFYDMSAAKMDFISVHLYDFNKHHYNNGTAFHGPVNHKGSRVEATFDMMEHYSMIKFDSVKPFFISEFGGRDHSIEWHTWSAIRDWQFMKSFSPLMMSFMERPNIILKSIPFIMNKVDWHTGSVPYAWRLMRQEDEPDSETGDYVFTELVKFYELWADVKGTRIDTKSGSPDILIDAYADSNIVYVILSNLSFNEENVVLHLFGDAQDNLESITAKHLHLEGGGPVIDTETLTIEETQVYTLDTEATAILKYRFSSKVVVDELMEEVKYYATEYLKEIAANQSLEYQINDVHVGDIVDGTLRIGLGRDHGTSLWPKVTFNNVELQLPYNYRGDDQKIRDRFFGLLEVYVPDTVLQANNTIAIEFPDDGGHVSSVAMQVYNYTIDNGGTVSTSNPSMDSKDVGELLIFPNPSSGVFNIHLKDATTDSQIQIYNSIGQLVSEKQFNSVRTEIDLSEFPVGIYSISVINEDQYYVNKVLKN